MASPASGAAGRPKWAQDYGHQSPKRPAKGRERVERRKETLGSPLPAPGSPLDKVTKEQRRRKMVPNPLSSPHHSRESHKVEDMGSPLPKINAHQCDSVYYGPGLRESGWNLWDRSEGLNERRLLYRTFFNTKWEVAVELNVTSFGSFRYSTSPFAKPILVSRSGVQREIDLFCAPKLMHELRTQQRNGGVRMQAARECFGEWVAEVRGMTILISQADGAEEQGRRERVEVSRSREGKRESGGVFEMIDRAEALPQACEHGRQKHVCAECGGKPSRPMQLLLHPDGFIFVGETMSPVSLPLSFQVEGGKEPKSCTLEEGIERIQTEMTAHRAPGFQEMPKNRKVVEAESDGPRKSAVSDEEGGHVNKGDWMGNLRRTLKSRTVMQRADEEAAQEFLRLPPDVRLDAVIFVEMQKVERDKKNGVISEEEYEERMAMVTDRTTFPAKALRAAEALHFAMFCDKKSKMHRSSAEFTGWDALGWEAKLDAAMMVLDKRSADREGQAPILRKSLIRQGSSFLEAVRRETEGLKAEKDLYIQREVHSDPQRLELVAGNTIDGFTKMHTEDLSNTAKLWKSKKGREVRQLYEECDRCGRPCQVAGRGVCNRCLEHEKEREAAGVENITIDPDTFYGDARALLKHPGFPEYKGPPLQSDLIMRQKIEPRLLQSSTGDRRGHLERFGNIIPEPIKSAAEKERDRIEWEKEQEKARLQTRRVMKLDGEDAVTEEEKADFGSLVRNDRFDAVKLLLMRDIATYSQEPIAEQRDSHGNTAIIVAAQQGLHKMSKLLIAVGCNLDAQNKRGDTALHYAALYGFHSLFQYLKRKGADDSMTNHAGKTCYDLEATFLAT